MSTDKPEPFIVFSDGHRCKVEGVPTETINSDGTRIKTFELVPTEAVKRKFRLRFPEDYYDLKKQTLLRAFPVVDLIILTKGYLDKELQEMNELINKLYISLKPFMGESDYERLKELTGKFIQQKRYLLGVVETTKDPQAPFQYFCFSDLNSNPAGGSNLLNELRHELKTKDKEIFSLKGKIAELLDQTKIANTQELEHLRTMRKKVDVIGAPTYNNTLEQQAAQDETFSTRP